MAHLFSAGPIPLRVREAQVPVVNDNECVRKINAVTEKIFILPASSFCAGGEEGHDACQVSQGCLQVGWSNRSSVNRMQSDQKWRFFAKKCYKFWLLSRQFAKVLGYFSPNSKSLGYSSVKILILASFETFWLLLGTLSGTSAP